MSHQRDTESNDYGFEGGRHYIGQNFKYGSPHQQVGAGGPDPAVVVEPDGRELKTGYANAKLPSYSPTFSSGGPTGNGAHQLAAAILYDVTEDAELASKHFEQFCEQVVARFDNNWMIREIDVQRWLNLAADTSAMQLCGLCGEEYHPDSESADDHEPYCKVADALQQVERATQ